LKGGIHEDKKQLFYLWVGVGSVLVASSVAALGGYYFPISFPQKNEYLKIYKVLRFSDSAIEDIRRLPS
jgi:hypothetical protein